MEMCEMFVKLSEFVENPDNPQIVELGAIERLVGKLKRIPEGLSANRIAYVTDHSAGKRVVISGNKRLRCLKAIYGAEAEVSSAWFADVTFLSREARKEYIINANVVEGEWLAELLMASHTADELRELMDDRDVTQLLADLPVASQMPENAETESETKEKTKKLTFKLTEAQFEKVERTLSAVAEDKGLALVEILKGVKLS
jgi:hypothetical protein